MSVETGPYLKVAAFCGDVIEGKDGVLSLIRVIDRLTVTAEGAGEGPPKAMPPIDTQLKLVIMLISGRARGTHSVDLEIEPPDGNVGKLWSGTILLEGEDRGANLVVDLNTKLALEGLYWFRVKLDETELTRVPFRLIYQRVAGGRPR